MIIKGLTRAEFYRRMAAGGTMSFVSKCLPNDGNIAALTLGPSPSIWSGILAELKAHQQTRTVTGQRSIGLDMKTQDGLATGLRHDPGDTYYSVDGVLIARNPGFHGGPSMFCCYKPMGRSEEPCQSNLGK